VNTDELVALLAKGAEPVDATVASRRVLAAIVCGAMGSVAMTLALLGLRPNLIEETLLPMFWVREAFCATLGFVGLALVQRLARPGMRLGWLPWGLAAPPAVMWLLAARALLAADPGDRASLVVGHTASVCAPLIGLVSAPLFVAFLWLMRGMAPTSLRLAGAGCGLAAGAFGALAYTLHCPELAAPFLGVWYVLGMLIPTALGAWLGPRLLRW
jgi:hypothetical protein